MAPIINPDQMEENPERPQVPPGIYRAQIVGCEQKESKQKTHYLNWKFAIDAPHNPSVNHRWAYIMTSYSGKGVQIMKQIFKSAFKDYAGGPIDTELCLGKYVNLTLTPQNDRDGNPSAFPNIQDVQPPTFEDLEQESADFPA